MNQLIAFLFTPETAFLSSIAVTGVAVFCIWRANKASFLQGLDARIEAQEQHLEIRQKILSDLGEKQAELFNISSQLEHNQRELELLQPELEKLRPEYEEWVARKEDAQRQAAEAKEEVERLAEQAEEYRRKAALVEELAQQVSELEKEIGQAATMRDNLTKTVSGLEAELDDLKDKHQAAEKDFEERLAEFEKDRQDAEKELSDTQKEVQKTREDLEKEHKEIINLRREVEELNDKKQRLDWVKELEAANLTLNAEIHGSPKGGDEEERIISLDALYQPVFHTRSNEVESDESEAVGALCDKFKDQGFGFPERIIRAFHTSLKTSDIACLTVMAGVSGTGKSALPRLYADAMGIHFLPIAVQPRWDGPDDLFGFFNYMENRYEATGLTRALLQFDEYQKHNEVQTIKDQLLLVLLDEMNLARIEYYFSEFLSKLEMRRDMDMSVPENRVKVATEIFAGESKKNREPVHIFAGANVLFVGTMNEDESTQSLSDKIIDRANVLRFGKPDKLELNEGGERVNRNAQYLSTTRWRSWIAKENELRSRISEYDQVSKTIDELNSCFEKLRRPFGHRTNQAILSYVANYPQDSMSERVRLRRALSDQVAMRLMPKLRGIDKDYFSEPLDHLRDLIGSNETLSDAALQEAFQKAYEQDFFEWHGLNWSQVDG